MIHNNQTAILVQHMIDECEMYDSKLSDWERDFIASIVDQVEADKRLSVLQLTKLDEIYERVTA